MASVKTIVLITLLAELVDRSTLIGVYKDLLVAKDDIMPREKTELANSTIRMFCGFNANFVHVYFEIGSSKDLTGFILKRLNRCGTTFLTLGYSNKDQNVTIVRDDGVMMYMLMILGGADELVNLSHLQKESADKHRSFFIVLVESSSQMTTGWLRSTFLAFWERWILNVVIVFWENGLQIYTYSPFWKYILKKLPSNTFLKEDLFTLLLLNMHRHKLRISLYAEEVRAVFLQNNVLRGTDGFMVDLVANRLNASKVVVVPEDNYSGEIYSNNTADGSIGYIIRNEADVALNTRFLLPHKFHRKVESTIVYGRDDLCVMVPASAFETPLFNIFRSFDRSVWTIVLILPFVVYLFLRVLSTDREWTFLMILSAMLNNSEGTIPHNSRFRFVIGIWLMYCFIILNFYGGNLTSNLVLPRMTSPINNIQQLVDSPLDILIYKRFAPHIYLYLNSSKPAQLELKQRVQAVTDKYFLDRIRSNDLTKAYIDKNHIVTFRIATRARFRRGRPLFHKMRECPVPFYTVYVVPYGSPYLGFINNILRLSQEHGIIDYWDRYMEVNSKLSGKFVVLHNRRESDMMIVIEMVHLQVAVYILLLGYGVSCLAFIMELLTHWRSYRRVKENIVVDLKIFDHKSFI